MSKIFMSASVLMCFLASCSTGAKREPNSVVCNVRDQHAVGDGKTDDTHALQQTIDSCPAGGMVLLPSGGTFLSGTIRLKSNLTFRVEPGAKLLGTRDTTAYPDLNTPTVNTQLKQCAKALIYAEGVENIVI
jgi:polygalacturonase